MKCGGRNLFYAEFGGGDGGGCGVQWIVWLESTIMTHFMQQEGSKWYITKVPTRGFCTTKFVEMYVVY